jgi:uncharacterized protein YbaA (DUF1428 family)
MTYVQGFLIPSHDKAGYTAMAAEAAPIFQDHGAAGSSRPGRWKCPTASIPT